MFVALELCERKNKRIIDRVYNILTKPKADIREIQLLNARFGCIRAETRDGAPDWREVTALAGRFADRMLLPDDVTPPEESGIRALTTPRHEKKVLLATACDLIDRTRMPMYRRVLGLIDPDGRHADLLHTLLKHYTSVRVATHAQDIYVAAAEEMMDQLGAPVLVGTSLSMLADCVLILAPGTALAPQAGQPARLPCPVLAGSDFHPAFPCNLIADLHIPTSTELKKHCPTGISPHRLAASLFEYCDADTGIHTASSVTYNWKRSSMAEIIQILMQNAGTAGLY